MSNRRMINTTITNSSRFLKLPIYAQNLYFHLAINTDDDGICEAYTILRILDCKVEDLKILIEKSFITVLNEDLVTYINDFNTHNIIRADRKKNSIYINLLQQVNQHVSIDKIPDVYNNNISLPTNVNQMTTICQPIVGQHADNMQPTATNKKTKFSIIDEEKRKNIEELINYYNEKKNTKIRGSKVLIRDIRTVLIEHSLEECKKVIDFILADNWYITKNQDTLSVIFRPEKFFEKLEKSNNKNNANILKNNLKNCAKSDFTNLEDRW